jgi:peptide/nickel transport system substrate-binding protein
MDRRRFVAGTAAGIFMPSLLRAEGTNTLRFIPQIDLTFLDPHFSTTYITRNHSYLVYDTLYGQDAQFRPMPQMVEGHTVSSDDKQWDIKLRDGLRFHDGEPVLAKDCVASIKRWARRDSFGEALMSATEELSAADDRTIRFKLKRPFPLLPLALGKCGSPMCAMMPERLAKTDAFTQIAEIVGSGPFRFVAKERMSGARNVYQRFEGYKPRESGTPDWTSGPKIAHFERVEWTTIPDASTAAAALQAGEQDWWEWPIHDLIPLLKNNKRLTVAIKDSSGMTGMMRPNHLQPPFSNPAIRRAVLSAIDQRMFMEAVVGDNPELIRTPVGTFSPGTPMASNAGLDVFTGARDVAKVKDDLKQAGYNGEKVVLLVPTDYAIFKAMGDVAADTLRRIGMNVEYVATDWGTMQQRRNKKTTVEEGGWSVFFSAWAGTDTLNPASHVTMRGNGEAFPGWSTSEKTEQLRAEWFGAPSDDARADICRQIQLQCLQDVPYFPLGQYLQPTAYRSDLTGILNGFSTFWNVRLS